MRADELLLHAGVTQGLFIVTATSRSRTGAGRSRKQPHAPASSRTQPNQNIDYMECSIVFAQIRHILELRNMHIPC